MVFLEVLGAVVISEKGSRFTIKETAWPLWLKESASTGGSRTRKA